MALKLYSYWRSTAAYRVRIALNLKGIDHEIVPVNLVSAEHRDDAYAGRNPQRLIPFLEDGDVGVAQSQAIIEYLDERYPDPCLYPGDAAERARIRAFAAAIACDIHPLNNLRVLKYLKTTLGQTEDDVQAWYAHWIREGFEALEAAASGGSFVFGESVTAADVFLVPQMYNARRFDVDVSAFPRLVRIDARCRSLPAFADAAPEVQADAP